MKPPQHHGGAIFFDSMRLEIGRYAITVFGRDQSWTIRMTHPNNDAPLIDPSSQHVDSAEALAVILPTFIRFADAHSKGGAA